MTWRPAPRTLFQERQLFEDMLDDLVAAGHEGSYVLVKNGEVQGFFEDEQAAYESGLDRFGLEPFLIELVFRRRSSWVPPSLQFLRT